MTYDNDNRLISYNGQTVANDTNGNLLSAPVSGTLLGALTWDARNRLLTAGGTTYVYDAENRRVSGTKASQTTNYTWSRGAALDRLLVKTNPDGSVTRYIYGLGLIYEETTPSGGGSATLLFYHYNWQGSTMALSDTAGDVTARLSYSPYGEVTVVSGTPNTPFLFNGQFGVMTEPNGLFCMQARFYSPIYRRFLSEDPAGFSGGINLYAFTGGDPVNLMDPFGLGPQLTGIQQGLVNALNVVSGILSPLRMLMGGQAERGDYQGSLAHLASLNSSSFNPARTVVNDDLSINYRGVGGVLGMLAAGVVLDNPGLFAERSTTFMPLRTTVTVDDFMAQAQARLNSVKAEFGNVEAYNMISPKPVALSRLNPSITKPWADPLKLERHGPFDMNKYTPIIAEEHNGVLTIQDGMTRWQNAMDAGINELPVLVYPRR
jgi:RHS repeat-associated protein